MERVRFDRAVRTPDGYGGKTRDWEAHHPCRAEFRYVGGAEETLASANTAMDRFKVRIRSCEAARVIKPEGFRMVDSQTDVAYNIRSVDAITDRRYVWLVCESGVAI